MKQNMAPWDRGVRLIIAAILLFLLFANYASGVSAWACGIIGFIFLATGLMGWCPLYALFKFSTIRNQQEKG
ncbi:MAG: DUF2892 domain-containing protein [Patescibacteria group bacterium]